MIPGADGGREEEGGELDGEGFDGGFELAGEGREIEREVGRAAGGGGVADAADGDERRLGVGEVEMGAEAAGEFVAGEGLGAGPVEEAEERGAFAELDQDLGEVVGGAGLADFVGVEADGAAGGPVGEEAFVEGAAARGAVAHEQGRADDGGEFGGGGEHGAFRGEFLAGVEVEGMRGGGDGVGRAGAIEDLLGGEVEQAGAEVVGEAGEEGGQGDVEGLGAGGVGLAGGGFGEGGTVDDRLGKEVEGEAGERGFVGEVERVAGGEAGERSGEGADEAGDVMAAAGGGLGEGGADQAGGAGEENRHARGRLGRGRGGFNRYAKAGGGGMVWQRDQRDRVAWVEAAGVDGAMPLSRNPARDRALACLCLALPMIVMPRLRAQSWVDEPFAGIRHTYRVQTLPRTVKLHVLEINLDDPGIRFLITPKNGTSGESAPKYVRTYVGEAGAQVGINAAFFFYDAGYWNRGLVASAGDAYSPWGEGTTDVNPWPAINISKENVVSILDRVFPYGDGAATVESEVPYNAASGNERIVVNGRNTAGEISYGEPFSYRARTCVGYTADRRLVIATADEVNGSSGMKIGQMADVLIAYGVVEGINLDGGGSTTLVFADPTPRVVNTPTEGERAVATQLVVFADPARQAEDRLVFADFHAGDRGTLAYAPTYSGSTQGVLATSTNEAVTDATTKRGWSQRLTIRDDPAVSAVSGNPGGGWFVRHLSGAGAAPTQNVERPATGDVGLRVRTRSPGVEVSMALDTGSDTVRGVRRRLQADRQWHVYQWAVADAAQWEAWLGSAGAVSGGTFTLDSVQFFGPDADAVIDIEWVAHDANGSLAPSAEETYREPEELLAAQDFSTGRTGWYSSGSYAAWNQATGTLEVTSADNSHVVGHFPRTELAVGDEVELTATVVFSGLPTDGNTLGFHVGLLDSAGGAKVTADGRGDGLSSTLFASYVGYRADNYINLPVDSTANPIRYYPREGAASGYSELINGPAGFGSISTRPSTPYTHYGLVSGTPYRLRFSVQRSARDEVVIDYGVSDPAVAGSGIRRPYVVGTHSIAQRHVRFDTVAFGMPSAGVCGGYTLDDIRVVKRHREAAGTYGAWRQDQDFADAAAAEPLADPDHDGAKNLGEYAFGGNPLDGTAGAGTPRVTSGETVTFRHRRQGGASYTVKASADLTQWNTIWTTADGWDDEAVKARVEGELHDEVTIGLPDGTAGTRLFWRVEVQDPD